MTGATHRVAERETQGATDFDAALEGYACGYMEPEDLLRAAGLVNGSALPLDPEHAEAVAGGWWGPLDSCSWLEAANHVNIRFAAVCASPRNPNQAMPIRNTHRTHRGGTSQAPRNPNQAMLGEAQAQRRSRPGQPTGTAR